jgi:hypothetical protein
VPFGTTFSRNNHQTLPVMSESSSQPNPPRTGSNSLSAVLCGIIICATVALVARLVISPKSTPARRLWVPAVVAANGNQATLMNDTRQMEFWTPSAKTGSYLIKMGRLIPNNDQWEVISNEDPVIEFGQLLKTNSNVLGYRRTEVWGQGRTGFKPGWWWTMSVLTNYTVEDLAGVYQKYWKSPQPVYVEVIDNRGSD